MRWLHDKKVYFRGVVPLTHTQPVQARWPWVWCFSSQGEETPPGISTTNTDCSSFKSTQGTQETRTNIWSVFISNFVAKSSDFSLKSHTFTYNYRKSSEPTTAKYRNVSEFFVCRCSQSFDLDLHKLCYVLHVLAVTNRVERTQSTQFVLRGEGRGAYREGAGAYSKIVAFERGFNRARTVDPRPPSLCWLWLTMPS